VSEKAVTLHKLLRLGALTLDEARLVCGWEPAVFDDALRAAVAEGLIAWQRQRGRQSRIAAAGVKP